MQLKNYQRAAVAQAVEVRRTDDGKNEVTVTGAISRRAREAIVASVANPGERASGGQALFLMPTKTKDGPPVRRQIEQKVRAPSGRMPPPTR